MGVQTSYNYAMPRGVAGSLYDLSDYAADSRLNAADKGQLLFGMGVVTGDSKGINIRVPKTGDTAAKFEGMRSTPTAKSKSSPWTRLTARSPAPVRTAWSVSRRNPHGCRWSMTA